MTMGRVAGCRYTDGGCCTLCDFLFSLADNLVRLTDLGRCAFHVHRSLLVLVQPNDHARQIISTEAVQRIVYKLLRG